MRATFPFQPVQVVLSNQQRVDLKVYTGVVLGAESNSVTHVSGAVINGNGSVTSDSISTGQIWLHAENGAKKSFVVADRLPFSPAVGHKVSVITGVATGDVRTEANLAIHGTSTTQLTGSPATTSSGC